MTTRTMALAHCSADAVKALRPVFLVLGLTIGILSKAAPIANSEALPADIVHSLVPTTREELIYERLARRLAGSEALIHGIERDSQWTGLRSFIGSATRRLRQNALIDERIEQLRLRAELVNDLQQRLARARSDRDERQAKFYEQALATARQRFAALDNVLETAGTTGAGSRALAASTEQLIDWQPQRADQFKTPDHPTLRSPQILELPSRQIADPVPARFDASAGFIPAYVADAARALKNAPSLAQRLSASFLDVLLGRQAQAAAPVIPSEASACAYTTEDLGQGSNPQADAKITTEISALAAQLGYSPARLYEFVQREIRFESYFGSVKGAAGTLKSKAGNATDQASLLIALLRASNVPARYVRGNVLFNNDDRVLGWFKVATYKAAAYRAILTGYPQSGASVPVVMPDLNNPTAVQLPQVWVEACVPYTNYRGAAADNSGYRWIPLDASFKPGSVSEGARPSVAFDYTGYFSALNNVSPAERYFEAVAANIRSLAPYYANNTLQDLGLQIQWQPLKQDVLPVTLPYEVVAFTPWGSGLTAETARLPESHRVKLEIQIQNSSKQNLAAAVILPLPEIIHSRLLLGFRGATANDVNALTSWRGDGNPTSLAPCTVNVLPSLKVETAGTSSEKLTPNGTVVGLCTANNRLFLRASLDERVAIDKVSGAVIAGSQYLNGYSVDAQQVAQPMFSNINSANLYSLSVYAFQASDAFLTERSQQLVTAVKANPNPGTANLEATEGELLYLMGLKYQRYVSDGARDIGKANDETGDSGFHLGVVTARSKIQYLFDLPFAITNRDGFLVDMPGMLSTSCSIRNGALGQATFSLTGLNASFFESYVIQETLRTDAISTARGLQKAKSDGIAILTVNKQNFPGGILINTDLSKGYPDSYVNGTLKPLAKPDATNDPGATLTIPARPVYFDGKWWVVYISERTTTAGGFSNGYIISAFSGGYSQGPVLVSDDQESGQNGASGGFGASVATSYIYNAQNNTGVVYQNNITPISATNSNTPQVAISSSGNQATANGSTTATTYAGDPVNMMTGNFYHSERDLAIKGRGGLSFVFERAYNSLGPKNGPLGYGWTHSFNQSLNCYGIESNRLKIGWIDGSGAERFYALTGTSVPNGSTFETVQGNYNVLTRQADGTYRVQERNGLAYSFESTAATTATPGSCNAT